MAQNTQTDIKQQPAPTAPTPESIEIAALKAQVERLMEAATRPSGEPLSPEEIQQSISDSLVPSVGGSTIRPTRHMLHATAKTPIFNGSRPTGRHG
jgi:hypothetical protein